LIGLIFTAAGGFATLESAINVVWNAPNRSFVMNKLFALLMLLVVGTLCLLSFGVTAAAQWAGRLPGLQFLAGSWGLRAVALVLPIGISGLMFTFIYRFYPNGRSTWKPSLIAGFVTAVLWELAKNGYALYTHYIHQEATYGTLGGLVGLIMWIYYSSALVLLGTELTWVLEGCPDMRDSNAGGLKNPERQEALAKP
jgi:membrane protein